MRVLYYNRINGNLVTKINGTSKDKSYEVFFSKMRVATPRRDVYMYPDTLIVSDEPKAEDNANDTLLNPSVVFEILPAFVRGIGK